MQYVDEVKREKRKKLNRLTQTTDALVMGSFMATF